MLNRFQKVIADKRAIPDYPFERVAGIAAKMTSGEGWWWGQPFGGYRGWGVTDDDLVKAGKLMLTVEVIINEEVLEDEHCCIAAAQKAAHGAYNAVIRLQRSAAEAAAEVSDDT